LPGICGSVDPGAPCRVTSRPGAPCMAGFVAGWTWGCLIACYATWPACGVVRRAGRPSPAWASSTRSRSSASRSVARVGMTRPRRCWGASVWLWSTPTALGLPSPLCRPPRRSATRFPPWTQARQNALRCHSTGLRPAEPLATPPSLRQAILDGGFVAERCREWSNKHGMRHHVVQRDPEQKGFVVLERRWVVERSFGWLAHWGGLLRDRAGRLNVSAARIAFAAILSGVEALLNPRPIHDIAN